MVYKELNVRGKSVKMDENLHGNIQSILDLIANNFDGVLLIEGEEGNGKSELGKQICLVADPNFSAANVVYSADELHAAIDLAKPGTAILFDEFVMAGLSTEALSKTQNSLIKTFTTIRKKRLIIIIIIPYIFMLRRYFALQRTRATIICERRGLKRGFFKFYNKTQKHWLYVRSIKSWFYDAKTKPSFEGRFVAWADNFLDVEEMERKKDLAIAQSTESHDSIKFTKRQMEFVGIMIQDTKSPFKDQTSVEHRNWYKVKKKIVDFNSYNK